MTDFDLENLKNAAVPAPRPHAKHAALDAAMNAFDDAQNTPQGNITPLRQTEKSTSKRSFRMYLSSRSTQAMAASIAALVIAAPFAFQHLEQLRHTPASTSVQQGPAPNAPGNNNVTSGQVTSPLKIDRDDLAIKGADPGSSKGTLTNPSDGLGAVGQSPDTMTLSIGGGTKPTGQFTQSPPPPPPAPAQIETSVQNAPRNYMPLSETRGLSAANGDERKMKADGRVRELLSADGALSTSPIARLGGAIEQPQIIEREEYRDAFEAKDANPVKQVASEPVSTFSTDVDTASYAFVRRAVNSGRLPPKDAVRAEEMINYFPYAYPAPDGADVPFKPTVTILPSPWNANNKLVHIAIKGYDVKSAERPRANLVFLIDVSGSMGPADRLPLLKNAFRMLVDQLKPDDTVAIVTYASGSGVALEPTKIADKGKILTAIDRLQSGGSTAGAAGIADAYRLAEAGFDKSAVNRVVLATDGDFNVGITDRNELKSYIERKRQSGIFLSILGVGQGNHNDALMQTLAQNGNGTAAYVDTLNEARKVLVDEASSTLFTIAKDVKAQIEWNPARVAEYRLIGYETRALRREDFNNDAVDAGDIGSGHTVTAIYEVTPVGAPLSSDALRYGKAAASDAKPEAVTASMSSELGFLKLRYKRPNEAASQLISLPLGDDSAKSSVSDVPAEQRFSIAVAAFAQLLKGESAMRDYTYDDVVALAQTARGDDPFGYRAEFLNLVRLAKSAQP